MRALDSTAHASRERGLAHPVRVTRWLPLALVLLVPCGAAAQPRMVVQQRVVGLLEPMGAEHMAALAVRADLGDPDELLFTGAHAEAGVVNHTSPIYSMTGGYLQVSPIALLQLRAQLTSVDVWPIGVDGAGYYPSQDGERPDLAGAAGSSASGFSFLVSGVLQGAFPIGDARLVLWSELSWEHLRLGDAPHHFSARHDAVLARQDDVIGDWSMLMVELPLSPGMVLRLGAYDDVRYVPRSRWLSNQLGAVAMLSVDDPIEEVGHVLPFVRAGLYTNHPRRAGDPTLLLGLLIRYELEPRAR